MSQHSQHSSHSSDTELNHSQSFEELTPPDDPSPAATLPLGSGGTRGTRRSMLAPPLITYPAMLASRRALRRAFLAAKPLPSSTWSGTRTSRDQPRQGRDVDGPSRGPLDVPLGAAPGNPTTVPQPKVVDCGISYRYGILAKEVPSNALRWSAHRWKETLNFDEFKPTTELELEAWFWDASIKVAAHGATAPIVINTLTLVAPKEYRFLCTLCFQQLEHIYYLADIADCFAHRLFPGTTELHAFERTVLYPLRQKTVLEAYFYHQQQAHYYKHMCDRRARQLMITTDQELDIYLRTIPTAIAREIKRDPNYKKLSIDELYQRSIYLEEYFVTDAVQTNYVHEEEEAIYLNAANKTPPRCRGCGAAEGTHFRKDCPHKNTRCARCGIAGHISQVCATGVMTDTAGRPRIIVQEKRTGADIKTRVDNTEPEQLKTMAGVVGRLLTRGEQEKLKARTKYQEQREEKMAKNPMLRKPPIQRRPVLLVEDDTEPIEEEEVPDLEEHEEIILFNEVYLAQPSATEAKSDNLQMRTECMINGIPTVALLDLGASTPCVSEKDAAALKILPDASKEPRRCQGIGPAVYAQVSLPVQVSITDQKSVATTFSILPTEIPILLSKKLLGDLQVVLDPATDRIHTDGQTIDCFHLTAGEQLPPPSLLQQDEVSTPESATEQKVKEVLAKTDLNDAQITDLRTTLLGMSDLWFEPAAGKCTVLEMDLFVEGPPKRLKSYPVPGHLEKEMNRQIDELLELGLIERSPACPWVSPCRLVPKPHTDPTKWRLVIDYRYVNSIMQDDSYALPRITDLIRNMADCRYFTLIDLNWGFWNVRLTSEAQQFTGFSVPGRGVFVWKVTPFGLKVSPTNFQRGIEITLRELIDLGICKVYIDDIIIPTLDVESNLKNLRLVSEALREGGFFLNFQKIRLLQLEALILGHMIKLNSILPDPSKVQGLVDAHPPKNKQELLSFCASANYLRDHVPKFSEVISPLTDLTGKYVRFSWESEHEAAFSAIKEALISAVTLTMPDFQKPFIILADASELAAGAVLCQLDDDESSLKFICFSSKKFNRTQRRWSPSERELFAIVWSCETYATYIKGRRPLLFTDHQSLSYLITVQVSKLQRWALRLMEFRPYVCYISGSDNDLADWMSRSVMVDDENLPSSMFAPGAYHVVHNLSTDFSLPSPDEMTTAARSDEPNLPIGTLTWNGNIAYGRTSKRIYVPQQYRRRVLLWFHASVFGGHQGVTRTTNRLKKHVFWPHMQTDVEDFIRSCPICNVIKPIPSQYKSPGSLDRPRLFQMVSMDFFGPRKYNNERVSVLVMVDHYSRYMVTVVMPSTTSELLIAAINTFWIPYFGVPRAFLSDNGTQFVSKEFTDYANKVWGAKCAAAFVNYPQGNGINESSHRILETAIKTSPEHGIKSVTEIVALATLLHNTSPNRSLGDTPASLTFGCDLHLPGLEKFSDDLTEDQRLEILRNYRGFQLLLRQLAEIEGEGLSADPVGKQYVTGDIVTYQLTPTERNHAVHATGEISYRAHRSLPHRVTKTAPSSLFVVPLWTRGKEKEIPKSGVRLISTFIPDLLRQQLKDLYPKMEWIEPETEISTATFGAPKPFASRAPLSKEEGSPYTSVEDLEPRKRRRSILTGLVCS